MLELKEESPFHSLFNFYENQSIIIKMDSKEVKVCYDAICTGVELNTNIERDSSDEDDGDNGSFLF
jgi:hypothetical protein